MTIDLTEREDYDCGCPNKPKGSYSKKGFHYLPVKGAEQYPIKDMAINRCQRYIDGVANRRSLDKSGEGF
jgi:hypothetical protein